MPPTARDQEPVSTPSVVLNEVAEQLHGDVPNLPLRMLNEFVYCPRLFYLEWVLGEWDANLDTDQGSFVHRNIVEAASHRKGPAQPDERPEVTRSIHLESNELALVGVADIVEISRSTAIPVEYKKGTAKRGQDGYELWPSDKVQLGGQMLLLEAAGFDVPEGFVWFDAIKRRVALPMTDDLREWVTGQIAAARRTAAGELPAPLVDSPKCPRCSLVTICLPGEHEVLADRSDARPWPRRLVPRVDETKPLLVTQPGSRVGVSGGRLVVHPKGEPDVSFRLIDISYVGLFTGVEISQAAITRLSSRGVPVVWMTRTGKLRAFTQNEWSKNIVLRQSQFGTSDAKRLGIARKMVAGKIRNSRVMIRRNSDVKPAATLRRLAALAEKAERAASFAELLGLEGAAARTYFSSFADMLRPDWAAESFRSVGRKRRPPPEPVNAALSFAYGLLAKELVLAATVVGLDPYLGVYHRPRFGRPALALDLCEEFRPLVADSVVVRAFNTGELTADDFVGGLGRSGFTQAGMRRFLNSYERRVNETVTHPVFGYKATYRRIFETQARVLGAVLMGEFDEYAPMVTR